MEDVITNNGKSDISEEPVTLLSDNALRDRENLKDNDEVSPIWVEECEHDFEQELYLKITSCVYLALVEVC